MYFVKWRYCESKFWRIGLKIVDKSDFHCTLLTKIDWNTRNILSVWVFVLFVQLPLFQDVFKFGIYVLFIDGWCNAMSNLNNTIHRVNNECICKFSVSFLRIGNLYLLNTVRQRISHYCSLPRTLRSFLKIPLFMGQLLHFIAMILFLFLFYFKRIKSNFQMISLRLIALNHSKAGRQLLLRFKLFRSSR